MKVIFFQILILFIFGTPCYSQNLSVKDSITQIIRLGDINVAEKQLYKLKKKNTNLKIKSWSERRIGDIHKIRGNMDSAYYHWNKSNQLRISAYGKDSYYMAWNYALISNYAYELWDTPKARLYADSAIQILNVLSDEQLLELEAHLIWRKIAQSLKQGYNREEPNTFFGRYEEVINIYENSISFQEKYNTGKYNIARAYHQLGNVYHDMAMYTKRKNLLKTDAYYDKAIENYAHSIRIMEALYGEKHFERGKTFFVMGMLAGNFEELAFKKQANQYFEQSLFAFDLEDFEKSKIEDIPNLVNVLMFLKYYTQNCVHLFKLNNDTKFLEKATKINDLAIRVWERVHKTFQTENTNQQLALYWLVPHSEKISLERTKFENDMPIDKDAIFSSIQKLKYYDLNKKDAIKVEGAKTNLEAFQKTLADDEVFLDFISKRRKKELSLLIITKNEVDFYILPINKLNSINSLSRAVNDFDYTAFTEYGQRVYDLLIPPKYRDYKKLNISPSGILHELSFDMLLKTNKNVASGDYRKLDYLILDTKVSYHFSSSFMNAQTTKAKFTLEAFAPKVRDVHYTSLPFSKKLVKNFENKDFAKVFYGDNATVQNFKNSSSSVLHLSSHGLIDTDYSYYSSILFSDTTLKLDNIKNIAPPELLVLNTCNSALGRLYSGDGINGFVRSFLAHGTKNILANIWEVDDKVSNEILLKFYENVMDGVPTTKALQQAKIEYVTDASSSKLAAPYYWAGHIYYGEEVEFEKEKNHTFKIIIFGGVVFLLGGVVLVGLARRLLKQKSS